MLSERLTVGMKLLLALLPIYYGALLLAALPDTWQWLLVVGIAMVALLVLYVTFDYPLQTAWPAFAGAFLIVACSCVLYQGGLDRFPLTSRPSELIAAYFVGALYIAWSVRLTWKAYSVF